MTVLAALGITLALMLVELRISRGNERLLVARGALAPADPVYPAMRWAYPGLFVAMAIEGVISAPHDRALVIAGIVVFAAAKALKAWAIASLGTRWTYRVFVVPGERLVRSGPYRWFRHPNYLGVIAELLGFALLAGARWSGPVAVLCFGELLRRRIRAEEQALGLSR
jgi:methyltransferase